MRYNTSVIWHQIARRCAETDWRLGHARVCLFFYFERNPPSAKRRLAAIVAMKSPQPSSIPPWDPDSRYPRRSYGFRVADIVGWSSVRVLRELGLPNEKRKGEAWRDDPAAKDVIVWTQAGTVMRCTVFGSVPHKIPPLQAYETWVYHNVRGMTWLLYLTRMSRIPVLK